jgi:hypothetical protein
MRRRTAGRYHSVLLAWMALLVAPRARAFDPFEIQVYDGTANAPGEGGLELHTNYTAKGQKTADEGEVPTHHLSHATLEPSIGVTRSLELGGYLQSALQPGGPYQFAGAKLRAKLVTPPWEKCGGWREHFRFGVNFELSAIPAQYETDVYGGEMRPIAAYEDSGWLAAFNPIVSFGLRGQSWRDGPVLEPAFSLYKKVLDLYSFGVEYYGSIGPIASPKPARDQLHYLFMAWNVTVFEKWEINLGVGGGLTAASDGMILKSILGHTF